MIARGPIKLIEHSRLTSAPERQVYAQPCLCQAGLVAISCGEEAELGCARLQLAINVVELLVQRAPAQATMAQSAAQSGLSRAGSDQRLGHVRSQASVAHHVEHAHCARRCQCVHAQSYDVLQRLRLSQARFISMDIHSTSFSHLTPKIMAGRLFASGMTGTMYILGEEGDDPRSATGAVASFIEGEPGAGVQVLELVSERAGISLIHHPEWDSSTDLIEMLACVDEPVGGVFHWQCFGRGGSMVYVILVAGGEAVQAMNSLQLALGGEDDEPANDAGYETFEGG